VTLSVIIPVRSLDKIPSIPPGADEVILQSGRGIAHARNAGARRATGDVLLQSDDDVELVGDLSWLRDPPADEAWWLPAGFVNATDDQYTTTLCAMLNVQILFRGLGASVGSFQAVRARAFRELGGYDETKFQEDWDLPRRLRKAYGRPGVAPVTVRILRPTAKFGAVIDRPRGGTDGPFRRLVPAQVATGGLRTG